MNGELRRRVEGDLNITYTYDAMVVFKFSCKLSIIHGQEPILERATSIQRL